jgi:anhydro-N-acetylmuramic acid kinase
MEITANPTFYIGLMSGTSLDGVDGVLVHLPELAGQRMQIVASAHCAFPSEVRREALALQKPAENEIHREALLANDLAKLYASCVQQLLDACADVSKQSIRAIGVHGQTIRHRPELGYTRQTNAPALLAELTDIDVIADFRSRDIAAGGQGAPLVPAFHRAIFGAEQHTRVVVNIGGISNISILSADGKTSGFDTGPGNVLMDAWMYQHQQKHYDEAGAWAAQGQVQDDLLASLCAEAYLHQAPPKSTGRDLFHAEWLSHKLSNFIQVSAVDVQATLCAFTAKSIADAIKAQVTKLDAVYVCGGGAYNAHLMHLLSTYLAPVSVAGTAVLGVEPNHVEALAFAWLAQQFCLRQPGNLPDVTGARGLRVLGALYPA